MSPNRADLPPPGGLTLSRTASDALARRRRGRNLALLAALVALVALFYFISIAKMSQHGSGAHVSPAAQAPR